MRRLPFLILILILICPMLHAAVGTGPNVSIQSMNIADSSSYRYLRVASASGGLWGFPGFRFMTSADGKTWRQISTNEIAFWDNTASAQCFTPVVVSWNNNFWVAYDVFATRSPATPGFTNRLGLAQSPDLLSWTNIGPIILPSGNTSTIWGGRWYMENNIPYFTYATQTNAPSHYCWIAYPTDNTGTNWSTPQLISPVGVTTLYDPCVIKSNSTYFLYTANTATGNINCYTNNVLTNSFTLLQANLFSGPGSTSLEGPCVVLVSNVVGTINLYRMYVVMDPGNIGKMYWSESTNLTTWSAITEVTDKGSVGDNGSVWVNSKQDAIASQNAELTVANLAPPPPKVYDITATNLNGVGYGLTNYASSQSIVWHTYDVSFITSLGKVGHFDLRALVTADTITGNDAIVGGPVITYSQRPTTAWGCTLLDNNSGTAGVYLVVTNANNGEGSRWHVIETVQSASSFPGWVSTSIDTTALQPGVPGTTVIGTAAAGNIGEVLTNALAVGAATSIVNNTVSNVLSLNLTAGDWDVGGNVNFLAAAATVTGELAGISTTSLGMPTDGTEVYSGLQTTTITFTNSVTVPLRRVNVSAPTAVYIMGKCAFSAGTMKVYGYMEARRVR